MGELDGKINDKGGQSRKRFGGLALAAIMAVRCASAPQAAPAAPAAARPSSSFARNLSLAMSLGSALAAGDRSATASFALTNNGPTVFEGCFGPSWGVSVIAGGHDAGHIVRAEHPGCAEKLTLLPAQKIVWSKTVPLTNLRAGTAKVTAWVKVVDPAACDQRYGCREVSVATPTLTMPIGGGR